MKKVYIKSYGCQMNVYDSERMLDILTPLGYTPVSEPREAHLVILNTCHIREKATEKVYSDLGRIHQLKTSTLQEDHPLIIAVAGCTAQAEGEEILKRANYVDMVFGPQTYHRLPEMLAEVQNNRLGTSQKREREDVESHDLQLIKKRKRIVEIDFPAEVKFDYLPEITNHNGVTAFLSIQEGCDKLCHFCVVPYTRGAEYSRPASAILKEAQLLVHKGVRELTLLGQNVNAYHGLSPQGNSYWKLGQLIEKLAEIEGLERIRYMTSHPKDVDQDLIDAHKNISKLMPFLHLPVQSGSNRILKNMNRKHTISDYFSCLEQFKKACPEIAFSTDIIVGYPGETEEDFQETLALLHQVKYTQVYLFKYSQRPGTPAATLPNQVSENIKTDRFNQAYEVIRHYQTSFNHQMIGKSLPVLWEKAGRHAHQLIGRSPYLQPVHANLPASYIGSITSVKITNATSNSLTGEDEPRHVIVPSSKSYTNEIYL